MSCLPTEECPRKPAAMPFFARTGKPDAAIISNSSQREGKPHLQFMDYIAEEGNASEFHDGLPDNPVTINEALNIPEAKAAVDKDWDKRQNLLAGLGLQERQTQGRSSSTGEK